MANPKLVGSKITECNPQRWPCPFNCNQCFYNHQRYQKSVPSKVPFDHIVRVNAMNDSNNQKDLVLAVSEGYRHKFYNTSVPLFDFPGPVIYTCNKNEEIGFTSPTMDISNLMAVRIRVSSTNLRLVESAVRAWYRVPVILTFMRYYDKPPTQAEYEWAKPFSSEMWCPTEQFIQAAYEKVKMPHVYVCGHLCKDCGVCEMLYWCKKEELDAKNHKD